MMMGFYLACLLLKARRLADTPLLLLLALAPPLVSTLYLLPEGTRRFVMLFSLQRCDLNMVADVCKWQAEEEDTRKIVIRHLLDSLEAQLPPCSAWECYAPALDGLFRRFDTNGDHKLQYHEFRRGLIDVGLHLREKEFHTLCRFADVQSLGYVDYESFNDLFRIEVEQQMASMRSEHRKLARQLDVLDAGSKLDVLGGDTQLRAELVDNGQTHNGDDDGGGCGEGLDCYVTIPVEVECFRGPE